MIAWSYGGGVQSVASVFRTGSSGHSVSTGVKGLSENIDVVSVVGRFLEHARIYHFHNGGEDEVYLSSADWMPRNFRRRVEIMFPLMEPALKRRVMSWMIPTLLAGHGAPIKVIFGYVSSARVLLALDGLEERLEVALAEAVVALALDELEEDRPDRVRREYLQQHLGVVAIDHALAVDQDAIGL